MRTTILCIATALAVAHTAAAQENHTIAGDTLPHAEQTQRKIVRYADPIDYSTVRARLDAASRPSFGQRIIGRLRRPLFAASPAKGLDLSATAGIGYTQETGFAVAAAATTLFRAQKVDTLAPLSNATLAASVSVTGFYRFRSTGLVFFRRGSQRLKWDMEAGSLPMRFWGLGYEAADINARTNYTHKSQHAAVNYDIRVAKALFAGVSLDLRHAEAVNLDATGLQYIAAQNQPRHAFSTGLGITARFDTRDNANSATRGIYLAMLTEVRPRALGDCRSTLWHITATADWYHPLWRDAVAAIDLYADLWSSATPWLFWPSVGGTSRLRGYYTGRYTDRKMVAAQVELRQHIYGPIGACIWAGAANVCASHKLFDWSEILPNYGLGVRLALGEKTSLRIDYGFGRRSNGLVINVNEAF